jgi:hypothetical protein
VRALGWNSAIDSSLLASLKNRPAAIQLLDVDCVLMEMHCAKKRLSGKLVLK